MNIRANNNGIRAKLKDEPASTSYCNENKRIESSGITTQCRTKPAITQSAEGYKSIGMPKNGYLPLTVGVTRYSAAAG